MNPTILVSKRGVQEQYGIPINTQEDLYRKGLFAPQLKVGGKIYYRRSDLEAWFDAQTVGGDGTA
ncbi:helix-turn-helix domain-containing protein [Mycobacterium sp. JS623]|uniref:helix-turn-helix domain-containing protein n=1 Tax=Mycobacterium sp. JS623 TaxID=212767 RepID=UPI000318CB48|nr:helix-turn-helix domain-containing protein [Mycobacterium sp. JS623]